MEQKTSIGPFGGKSKEHGDPVRVPCALCREQPAAGGPDALLGEPLCRGPVCRWCYETKVMPARRHADGPEGWSAHGAWALRTPEGSLVIGTTVGELVTAMMDEGYFGMVQDMDGIEACIEAVAATAVKGRPAGVEAFGRTYSVPWYGPALLTGPRHVVPVMARQEGGA